MTRRLLEVLTHTSRQLWSRDWSDCEDSYADKFRSWCDRGDLYCDTDSPAYIPAHLNYVHTSGQDVVEWVIQRWNQVTGDDVKVDAGGRFPTYLEWLLFEKLLGGGGK